MPEIDPLSFMPMMLAPLEYIEEVRSQILINRSHSLNNLRKLKDVQSAVGKGDESETSAGDNTES